MRQLMRQVAVRRRPRAMRVALLLLSRPNNVHGRSLSESRRANIRSGCATNRDILMNTQHRIRFIDQRADQCVSGGTTFGPSPLSRWLA